MTCLWTTFRPRRSKSKIKMNDRPGGTASIRSVPRAFILCLVLLLVATARCARHIGPVASGSATLRIGIGGLPLQTPQSGLRQLVANLSLEGLVNFNEDGRPRPWLAEGWTIAPDRLSVTVQLRKHARFHDGTLVTAPVVVQALLKNLPDLMGPAFEDVSQIVAENDEQVRVTLRQPSQFLLDALDVSIQMPDEVAVGTGPFTPTQSPSTAPSELRATVDYYLGRPGIDKIVVTPYPTVRAAWADLLRGNIDMLHEVNADALDSLQGSTEVSVFSFVRHYQYAITFGNLGSALKSAEVRRELNAAIDRDAIVRVALSGHGLPSTGPIPPHHWALTQSTPRLEFNSDLAKRLATRKLHFTCLVPADSVYERVALAVKQQLATVSVDMQVVEATQEQILKATRDQRFEAVLVDPISGPNVFRSYRQFYSKASFVPKPRSSAQTDAALDRIRHASSDDEYRVGVTAFQQAIINDPPALFIAWGERARAVSRRFDVPVAESGRDVLATLRLWRPVTAQQLASRN